MREPLLLCDCDAIHEDVVNAVKAKMESEGNLYDLADFFKVLGDSTRIKILSALDQSEMCVCDLAVLLNMTKSAISHQLRSLKLANLVKYKRDGRMLYYSLSDDHIRDIVEKGMEHIKEK